MLSIYYKLEKFYYYPAASIFKPMIRILSLMKVQVQFFDVRNIVPVLFSRSSIINRQSLHFNMFVFLPLGINEVSLILYFILFLSIWYLLFTFIYDYKHHIGTRPSQYPTFREYAFVLFYEYFYGRTYYNLFLQFFT